MAARVARLVMADVRPSLEPAKSDAGTYFHRAVPAWFRLPGPLSECGLVAPAGQANVGAADRHGCTLRVDDAVAGDGGRDTRLLRARRSRSDLVLAGGGLAALRRAHRGDCGDHRGDVAGAGRALYQHSGLVQRVALARRLRRC